MEDQQFEIIDNDTTDKEEEENDGKGTEEGIKANEQRIYDEVYNYLTASRYPGGATKADKATIRKRAKKFEVVDGVLHYKENKASTVNLRQVSSLNGYTIHNSKSNYGLLYILRWLILCRL